MLLIDQYAYTNQFKHLSPTVKILFSLLGFIVAIAFAQHAVHGGVILVMLAVTVFGAKIPLRFYIKMFSIPLFFILMSILGIIISFSYDTAPFIHYFTLGSLNIGITQAGIDSALMIFSRSMACISSMYFLILTTPINDLLSYLAKHKFPQIVLEMSLLIYRFIFIFIHETNAIITAQTLRFGYSGIRNSYQSLSALITVLFTRIFIRYDEMRYALECKCFSDQFYME